MTDLGERTLQFASSARSLPTQAALKTAFAKYVQPLGGRNFAAIMVSGPTFDQSTHMVASLPQGWSTLYRSRGFDADDPVLASALASGKSGYWKEHLETVIVGPDARRVLDAASSFDMREGYTGRVRLEDDSVVVVMVGGNQLDDSPHAREALDWTTTVFARNAARLLPRRAANSNQPGADPRNKPTRKQLEVLFERSIGLRNDAVARKLDLSVKTVESHVSAALKRMQARTMTEAVRIAVENGWFRSDNYL